MCMYLTHTHTHREGINVAKYEQKANLDERSMYIHGAFLATFL